jgi:predicted RNA-binding protein YlxR (DUF448 family)
MIKKTPMRTCMGCNTQRTKKELVRVVRSPDGIISLDLTGKAPGRGAYICPDVQCLKKARKARRFERSLSCEIGADIYDLMEKQLENAGKTL